MKNILNKIRMSFPRRRESIKTTNYLYRSRIKSGMTVVAILLLPFVFFGLYKVISDKPSNVKAFGQLTVDLGVPSGDPIFVVHNMLPGDCENREVKITNGGDEDTHVAVRSANVEDTDNLSTVLSMLITENSTTLYSDSLANFFVASGTLDGVPLSTLSPLETKTYNFKVCFDQNAGNDFQNTRVVFDLIFGEVISPFTLPDECKELTGIITFVVEGTEGDDDIRATHENELILGFGGDDELDGNGGDDCIVGGEGKDEIDGGQGKDIILGGAGNDDIDGGQGNDIIYGGDEKDEIDGGSGEDIIYGNAGDDEIDGRSHNDLIYGGSGNDILDGGSGEDDIYGEEGDDTIDGSTQNDFLDGGADTDDLDGGTGTDTCVNGETLDDCEL